MSEASKSLKNVSFLKEKTGENTKQKNHQNEYVSIFCLECKLNRFDVCVYGEDGSIFFSPFSITTPQRNAVSSRFNFQHVDCKKLCQLTMPKALQAENDCLHTLFSIILND